MHDRNYVRRVLDWMVAAGFVIALFAPVSDSIFGFDSSPVLSENRSKNPFPPATLLRDDPRAYAGQVEAYFDDRLGLRKFLIRHYNYLIVKVFGSSPRGLYDIPDAGGGGPVRETMNNVLVGRDGWLFLAGYDNRIVADFRGIVPLTGEELAAWKRRLEERQAWLAARGIAYLFVIVPDKQSVYPEFMPSQLARVSQNPRRIQLTEYLRRETTIPVLDLTPALLAAKKSTPQDLYFKTDTHWNDLGAHAAYTEIVRTLALEFPRLSPKPMAAFSLHKKQVQGQDLARFLALADTYGEPKYALTPNQPRIAKRTANGILAASAKRPAIYQPFAMETGIKALPRAMMLRDSFTTALEPFLSEHFEYIAYYWPRFGHGGQDAFTAPPVEAARPDVLIEEWVERDLLFQIPRNEILPN